MVLFLAFSLQDQVEKYGAYVGIAAFFGLAVLTVLYFSQAREVRRLRDWAGRAPERAQELEARVAANAQAARTVQAVPKAATPAAAAAVAAGTGAVVAGPQTKEEAAAAGPATQVAEPVEGEKAVEGDGAAPQAEPAVEGEQPAEDGGDGEEPKAEPAAAPAAVASPGEGQDGDKPAEEAEGDEPAEEAEGEPAPAAQAVNGAAASEEEQEAPAEAPAGATNGAPAQPADVPPVPRATPVPRRAPAPAAPLRQPTRSATMPPRRATPAARRAPAAPAGDDGRRSWVVPAILGVVILGAIGFGATQLLGGDDPAPSTTSDQPSASATADGGTAAEPSQGGAGLTRETARIAVLNGTTIPGLAATEADKLKAAGFTREITTGNNTDQQRSESSLLYAQGARPIAREVARRLDIAIVEQIDADTRSLGEDADVVVILGQDKAP